jgi:hypothetical protein
MRKAGSAASGRACTPTRRARRTTVPAIGARRVYVPAPAPAAPMLWSTAAARTSSARAVARAVRASTASRREPAPSATRRSARARLCSAAVRLMRACESPAPAPATSAL